MQLIQLDLFVDLLPQSHSGKTCPESSTRKTMPSDVSWRELLDRTFPLRPVQRATNGRAQVWLPDQNAAQLGECWTLNFSECPNAAEESTLSQVIVTESSSLNKYFLSAQACAGILKRAKRRGKALPAELKEALLMTIGQSEVFLATA